MMRGTFKLAVLAGSLTAMSLAYRAANAAVVFTQDALLSMQIVDVMAVDTSSTIDYLSPPPEYLPSGSGVSMSGLAGSRSVLTPVSNTTGFVYYSLVDKPNSTNPNSSTNGGIVGTLVSISDFLSTISGAGEILGATAYNDNQQQWSIGIWYQTIGDVIFEDTQPINAGGSQLLSLILPDPSQIKYIGVSVHWVPGTEQEDIFHASWGDPPPGALPEPASIAVWGLLAFAGIGGTVIRRRKQGIA